jgi:hypothetical protein
MKIDRLIKMTIDVLDMALAVEMDFMIEGESGIKVLGWIQMIYICHLRSQ